VRAQLAQDGEYLRFEARITGLEIDEQHGQIVADALVLVEPLGMPTAGVLGHPGGGDLCASASQPIDRGSKPYDRFSVLAIASR